MVGIVVLVILVATVPWVFRRRFERGTTARRVATGVAVVLSLLGLGVVAYGVVIAVAITSWANNK